MHTIYLVCGTMAVGTISSMIMIVVMLVGVIVVTLRGMRVSVCVLAVLRSQGVIRSMGVIVCMVGMIVCM